jgi:hypothetical protein
MVNPLLSVSNFLYTQIIHSSIYLSTHLIIIKNGSENNVEQEMAPDIEAQTNKKNTDTESPGIFMKANRPVTLKVYTLTRSSVSILYIYNIYIYIYIYIHI